MEQPARLTDPKRETSSLKSTVKNYPSLVLAAAFSASLLTAPASAEPPRELTADDIEVSEVASFLRPSEEITLSLSWGIITAGQTRLITTLFESEEGPRFRVRVISESKGIVDTLYPIRNDSESIIDPATGRPLVINISGTNGKDTTSATTTYDYDAGKVIHTDHIREHRSGSAKLPDEPIFDIMVTMMRVRDWGIKPGEVRTVKASFEDDVYELQVNALREEKVKTRAGTFNAVKMEVTQLGELKGFFENGGKMWYWISTGPNPQIVRMDMKMKVGTIKGVLRSVRKVKDPTIAGNA